MKKTYLILVPCLLLTVLFAGSCKRSATTTGNGIISFFVRDYAPMVGGRPLEITYTYADSSGFIETYTARNGRITSLKQTVADTRNILASLVNLASDIPGSFSRRGDTPGPVSEFYPAHLEFFVVSNAAIMIAWSGESTAGDPEIKRYIAQLGSLASRNNITVPVTNSIVLRADLLDKKTSSEYLGAGLCITNIDFSRNRTLSNAVCYPFKLVVSSESNPFYPYRTDITAGSGSLDFIRRKQCFQARIWNVDTMSNP
jgi:hypothetical protein